MLKKQCITFLKHLETTELNTEVSDFSIYLEIYLDFLNIDIQKILDDSVLQTLESFSDDYFEESKNYYILLLEKEKNLYLESLKSNKIIHQLTYTPWDQDYYHLDSGLLSYARDCLYKKDFLIKNAIEKSLLSTLYFHIYSNFLVSISNINNLELFIQKALFLIYSNVFNFPKTKEQLKHDFHTTSLGHLMKFIEFRFDTKIKTQKILNIIRYLQEKELLEVKKNKQE